MRKRVAVYGRVQGVFFRDSTRQLAERAGVAGWVANRDDGAVEAVLEGDADAVEEVVRFMRSGPRGAEVERTEVGEEEAEEGLTGFAVR